MVMKLFYAEPEWCHRDHIKSFQPWTIVGSLCFKVPRQNLEIHFRTGCWECPLCFQNQSWHYMNLGFCQPIVLILKKWLDKIIQETTAKNCSIQAHLLVSKILSPEFLEAGDDWGTSQSLCIVLVLLLGLWPDRATAPLVRPRGSLFRVRGIIFYVFYVVTSLTKHHDYLVPFCCFQWADLIWITF